MTARTNPAVSATGRRCFLVRHARLIVARALLRQRWVRRPAVGRSDEHRADATLQSAVACLTASTPSRKRSNNAVHRFGRANITVARLLLAEHRTCLASADRLHKHRTRAALDATATLLGADTEGAPLTHSTVHRADVFVARHFFGEAS